MATNDEETDDAPDATPDLIESAEGGSIEWARLLRERREAAGFSRAELARRAGIAEATLKRIESGLRPPSSDVLLRLLATPELRLREVPPAALGGDGAAPGFSPNGYFPPGVNAIELWQEMIRALNGQGGHVDQTHLYLDHHSAAAWQSLATHETRLPERAAMPLDAAATAILDSTGPVSLDVVALGPGDAREEVRLTQHLLDDPRHRDIRLCLLDISQPLLSAAMEYATRVLDDPKWVSVMAVHGNFHHLPRYRHLLHGPQSAHRRRLVTMFGATFTNLQNEPLFIRNGLGGFGPGDLLLFNAGQARAPTDQPDEIRKKDRALADRDNPNVTRRELAVREWICGPLRRYVDGLQDVTITAELDLASCPVPGSYAVVRRATVTLSNGEIRTFSLFSMKRYDEKGLVECFRQEGWDSVARWHAGTGLPSILYLFRKR